jgi:hypothetical protein
MHLLKYLQLPFYFDVQKMQTDIANLATQNWVQHYQKTHYEGDWTVLPLRSVNGAIDNIYVLPNDANAYANTIFLEACPYLNEVLTHFKFPLKNVRLLKLAAGAVIKDHCDKELNFENGEVRLHIPIVTNKDVKFYLQEEQMHLQEGECWYMNFNLNHRVSNNSSTDRIHLVIDGEVNDWVKNLFATDTIMNKKEIEVTENNYDDATKRQMIERIRLMNTVTGNKLADDLEASLIS